MFQTMMDDIFDGLIMEGVVVVYLDDILIFTETLEEHQRVTRRVMELLRKNNLFLKPKKCKFKKTEVEYLGVIISQNSVKMDPVKVAGVTEWPIPSNRKEVQSFLGFTNFYRRFIQGFSHLAVPCSITKSSAVALTTQSGDGEQKSSHHSIPSRNRLQQLRFSPCQTTHDLFRSKRTAWISQLVPFCPNNHQKTTNGIL